MKCKNDAEKQNMGDFSPSTGEEMTQGTPYYFSTAICEEDGKVRDLSTGVVWDNVEAWHKDRHGRAATLTYSFPFSREASSERAGGEDG